MNTHKNEEVVKKMADELLRESDDKERPYEKIYTNISFIEQLIEKNDYNIERVAFAGLDFLLELEEKGQLYLLNSEHCGTPKNALEVLFAQTITEGYEEKITESIIDMYKKGKESGLIMFEIFKKVATQKSTPHLQKLLKEMAKEIKFSKKGAVQKKFLKYKKEIKNLIDKYRPQELPLFPLPQH